MLDVTTKERKIRALCEDTIEHETGDRSLSYKGIHSVNYMDINEAIHIAFSILDVLNGVDNDSD